MPEESCPKEVDRCLGKKKKGLEDPAFGKRKDAPRILGEKETPFEGYRGSFLLGSLPQRGEEKGPQREGRERRGT